MTRIRATLISVIALFTIISVALALEVGAGAPDFSLKDQFDKVWVLQNLKGTVIVIVAANKNSGRAMGPWVDKLKATYSGKIQLLGLLDLHDVPGIGRGIARSRIKDETKDPMMLDFHGNTGKAYEVSSDYPVVVVIDKSSVVRSVQKTNYTDQAFNSTTSAINAALKSN